MPVKVAYTPLNATSIDINNVIRAQAPLEYQQRVPKVETLKDVPKVGEIILGYPALANQYINPLMNQVAFLNVRNAIYSNPYSDLKKGGLTYGETIEEAFVEMAKAQEFSAEKAEERELKRTLPDVRAAFHVINWDVQYPITIQFADLERAVLNESGATDLVGRVTNSISVGVNYDEFNLIKYLLIKGFNNGEIYNRQITTQAGADAIHNAAITFRQTALDMGFMNTQFNLAGVHTVTPIDDIVIFMPTEFVSAYDINVLAASFHMDRATFIGKLHVIDSFTTFDNDRFAAIRAGSTMIEEVTDAELSAMANVKAIICDKEYFQIYDNLRATKFTEKYVAAGDYWNYFYRDVKVVSTSPFSNAIAITAAN